MRNQEKASRGGYRFYRLKGSGCVSVWGKEGFVEEIYTHSPLDSVIEDYLNNTKKSKKRSWLVRYILYSLGFSDDE